MIPSKILLNNKKIKNALPAARLAENDSNLYNGVWIVSIILLQAFIMLFIDFLNIKIWTNILIDPLIEDVQVLTKFPSGFSILIEGIQKLIFLFFNKGNMGSKICKSAISSLSEQFSHSSQPYFVVFLGSWCSWPWLKKVLLLKWGLPLNK